MSVNLRTDDNCRLWVEQPLVFCHGGPGLWDYLDDVAVLLGDVARTTRWDQRGCGRSQRRGPYTVARFVADLDRIREHTGQPRIGLLGHSWGATLALRYALAYPDRVSHLIYVSGTGVDPDDTWKPTFYAEADRRAAAGPDAARRAELSARSRTPDEDREYAILEWSMDYTDPVAGRRHAERMATPWPGINWECAEHLKADIGGWLRDGDGPARCRDLAVPTLIIDGDRDQRPRWAVDSLARALPDVRRVILTGAGHLPWVEDPDGFRRAVAEFLGVENRCTATG
jgi:proline iminopeptidase